MKLRTKIIIALLGLSFFSLILAAVMVYDQVRKDIVTSVVTQIDAMAGIQEGRIEQALSHYLDIVGSMALRPTLVSKFLDYEKAPTAAKLAGIQDYLADMVASTYLTKEVALVDMSGRIVAASDTATIGSSIAEEGYFKAAGRSRRVDGMLRDGENTVRVRMTAPLLSEGRTVGVLVVIASADPVLAVTGDYTGLRDTGEAVLVKMNAGGDAVFLTPSRFDGGAALRLAVSKKRSGSPAIIALAGHEVVLDSPTTNDYRGVPVFASTRYIDPVGWGLVVKIDQEEALWPVANLLPTMWGAVAFALLLAFFFAYLIADLVARPIRALSSVADRLGQGDLDVRARVSSGDEVGDLSRSFNIMADSLRDSQRTLERKVDERTRTLTRLTVRDEAILQSIGEGLFATNILGRITLINDKFTSLLGIAQEQALGKRAEELFSVARLDGGPVPEADHPVEIILRKQPQPSGQVTAEALHVGAYVFRRGDGSGFPVSVVATPMYYEGRFGGVVVVFRDISAERAVDKAKSEFVSLASHQLRTPLTSIKWNTELLAGTRLTAKQRRYVEAVAGTAEQMTTLVDDLLNASRIELGTLPFRPSEIDLDALLDDVIRTVRHAAEAKGIVLEKKRHEKPLKVFSDPGHVRAALQNVLVNAIKYTPEKGTVTVDVRSGPVTVEVDVTDTGYGIPPEQQQRIFSRMFRADNVKAVDVKGTGLGLYLAKAMMDNMGGSIRFVSELDKGTTFTLTFPRRADLSKR